MSKDADKLAKQFHEAYERLAPSFGYKTRKASAVPWEDVPENNRLLMQAVIKETVLARIEELEVLVEDAYQEGWHTGRQSTNVDGDYTQDWLDSDANK